MVIPDGMRIAAIDIKSSVDSTSTPAVPAANSDAKRTRPRLRRRSARGCTAAGHIDGRVDIVDASP